MIRVGIVCDSFEVGGQEQGCLEVLRRLDRRRFTPFLYLFRPGSLLPAARALGVQIEVGHDKPGADARWTAADDAARAAWGRRLPQCLRRDRIDVCLVYAWPEAVSAAEEAEVGALVERIDGPALSGRIRDKSAFHRIICESKLGRDVLLAQRPLFGCRRDRMIVIPNGVDLHRFDARRYHRGECRTRLGLRGKHFVIGTVARLAPEKNLGQLLRAVRHVMDTSRQASRVHVVVAGPDRGEGEALAAETRRLGIEDRVHFLGSREDVPEILRACDAYVLSSLYEGTPFSLLEAMAMGLPVVANQVGGAIEVVSGNGFLVPALQSEDTGAALAELAEDPALAARLGRRSRRLAERRYGIERMIGAYERVLVEALEASGAATGRAKERAS